MRSDLAIRFGSVATRIILARTKYEYLLILCKIVDIGLRLYLQ